MSTETFTHILTDIYRERASDNKINKYNKINDNWQKNANFTHLNRRAASEGDESPHRLREQTKWWVLWHLEFLAVSLAPLWYICLFVLSYTDFNSYLELIFISFFYFHHLTFASFLSLSVISNFHFLFTLECWCLNNLVVLALCTVLFGSRFIFNNIF